MNPVTINRVIIGDNKFPFYDLIWYLTMAVYNMTVLCAGSPSAEVLVTVPIIDTIAVQSASLNPDFIGISLITVVAEY